MLFTDGVLAAGLLSVYLIDSVHWLEYGELAIESRAGRARRIAFGPAWTLAGRRPWLPAPFTDTVVQRVRWSLEATRVAAPVDVSAALRWPARFSMCNAWIVALVAPVLLLLGRQWLFVGCVAVSWLLTLASGAFAARRRATLGATAWQIAGATLLAMVCLPCGGNLARAFASCGRAAVRLPEWVIDAMPKAMHERALAAVRAELEYESTWVDEDSPRRAALTSALESLGGRRT